MGIVVHVIGTYIHGGIERARGNFGARRQRLSAAQKKRVDAKAAIMLLNPQRAIEMKVDFLHLRFTVQNLGGLNLLLVASLSFMLANVNHDSKSGRIVLNQIEVVDFWLLLLSLIAASLLWLHKLREVSEFSVAIETYEDKQDESSHVPVGGQPAGSVQYGDRVVLITFDGSLLWVDTRDGSRLKATESGIAGRGSELAFQKEIFEVIDPKIPTGASLRRPVKFGDEIALRWVVNGQIVGVDPNDPGKPIVANVAEVQGCEMFRVTPGPAMPEDTKREVSYGMPFGLYAYNKVYVGYTWDAGKDFCACVERKPPERIGDWERFMFIKPF